MSLFRTIEVPGSKVLVQFTDDDAGAGKVFVCVGGPPQSLLGAPRRPFSEFSRALERGVLGESMADGFYRLNEEERCFLENLSEDAGHFTWAMNIAVHEGPEHPDAAKARAVLDRFGDASSVFDRHGCGGSSATA